MMRTDPIFVAGLERSGTSLMYALLASHPNITMTRRTNLWTYFYGQYGDLSQPENFERCLEMMLRYKRLVVLNLDPDRLRNDFQQGEPTYGRLFALIEEQVAERTGKARWGDKSLHIERYATPIFDAYPNAKIIHMMRDPRDRYASVLARWKTRRGDVGAGTAMWLSSAELAHTNQAQFPDRYKIVRYETLATRPEPTLHDICAFIDEPYTAEMLTMEGAKTFKDQGSNSSYGSRTPGVISTNSIGRYHQVLTAGQITFIQNTAREEMLTFDYPSEPITMPLNERIRFTLADWPLNAARFLAWRTRHTIKNRTGHALPDYRLVTDANGS